MSVIDDAPRARRYEASFAGSVAILAWPEQADDVAECGRTGVSRLLLARCGSVVSRGDLGVGAWPDGVPGTRAVDARLRRLRDRVEPLGLQIHNVRRRGLLLEVCQLGE